MRLTASVQLRMARRDFRFHRRTALLIVLLVMVPNLLGTALCEFNQNAQDAGEKAARSSLGDADALLTITQYASVRLSYGLGDTLVGTPVALPAKAPKMRDPSAVDLARLVPAGTRLTPAPRFGQVQLASGGDASVMQARLAGNTFTGIAAITTGVAPTSAREVAISSALAQSLNLLATDGLLERGARLEVPKYGTFTVTGLLDDRGSFGREQNPARIVIPPGSSMQHSLGSAPATPSYLATLPASTVDEARSLGRVSHLVAELGGSLAW